ncbi:ER lumen protein-retaining receptor B, variant 2 [Trebouxia sp. C0010 RCD-2024]
MKLVFLASSATIIYYMRFHRVVRTTYDRELDTFRSWLLIVPCFLLALVINQGFAAVEILWAFSLYLEAVAILPQLVLLQRTQNIDNLTGNYILLLGAYRALYILNWIYKLLTEDNYRQWIVWTSGLVQTALYADFFYYYFRSWQNNEKLSLPT